MGACKNLWWGVNVDLRNSKKSLLAEIERLEAKLEEVYAAGRGGIAYVGTANYQEREDKALHDLDMAMYGVAYE